MEVNGQLETCKNRMSILQIVVYTSFDFVIVVSNQCVDKTKYLIFKLCRYHGNTPDVSFALKKLSLREYALKLRFLNYIHQLLYIMPTWCPTS